MHLSVAARISAALAAAVLLTAYPASAKKTTFKLAPEYQQLLQTQQQQGEEDRTSQKEREQQTFMQGVRAALNSRRDEEGTVTTPNSGEKQNNLGSLSDPNSPKSKANRLANQAIRERKEGKIPAPDDVLQIAPPLEIEALQNVSNTYADMANSIHDEPVSQEVSMDMRKESQKEAALSYGARGGLAKRNYQIMEQMKGFSGALDKVFDFRMLLIRAPSGLMIEPPIIKESLDALVITDNGNEAAVAEEIFDIGKSAKIVSAPRDWRQYLIQPWTDVPPPPRVLWPRTEEEQANWDGWVAQGWAAGINQADQIFESSTNRMTADYKGMVRYRVLLAQGMISEPYALHEDRGVIANKNQMRVGDRALRITGPSQFVTGTELWKPADR